MSCLMLAIVCNTVSSWYAFCELDKDERCITCNTWDVPRPSDLGVKVGCLSGLMPGFCFLQILSAYSIVICNQHLAQLRVVPRSQWSEGSLKL